MGSSSKDSGKKYPASGSSGTVNVVLDTATAETLLVALNYALSIEPPSKKKKKKKKKSGKTPKK